MKTNFRKVPLAKHTDIYFLVLFSLFLANDLHDCIFNTNPTAGHLTLKIRSNAIVLKSKISSSFLLMNIAFAIDPRNPRGGW